MSEPKAPSPANLMLFAHIVLWTEIAIAGALWYFRHEIFKAVPDMVNMVAGFGCFVLVTGGIMMFSIISKRARDTK